LSSIIISVRESYPLLTNDPSEFTLYSFLAVGAGRFVNAATINSPRNVAIPTTTDPPRDTGGEIEGTF